MGVTITHEIGSPPAPHGRHHHPRDRLATRAHVGANVTHEINFAESINFRRHKRSAPFSNSFYDFSILGILIQELGRNEQGT